MMMMIWQYPTIYGDASDDDDDDTSDDDDNDCIAGLRNSGLWSFLSIQ